MFVEMDDGFTILLLALLAIAVIASPFLAIAALVRVRNLQSRVLGAAPDKLKALEQRIAGVERALSNVMDRFAEAPSVSQRVSVQPSPPSVAPPPTARVVRPPLPPAAGPPPQAKAVPSQPPPPAVGAPRPPDIAFPPPPGAPPMDLETRIAGRWLNRIGIVALLFAVTYFLKYAFDNNWIGPTGRVGIGILLGSAMIPWSQWLLGRGYTYFSEGITGLGEAVLYTSVWAGWGYYNLYSQTTAFAAMIVVTAAIAAVALGRNSQRIAILSLLGGFLTPILVSTGKNQEVVLFTYVLILGGGMLVIAWRRDWRWLAPIGYLLTQAYFWAWYQTFYASLALIRTIFFAALFFALYLTLPAMRVVRFGKIDGFDVGIVLMNGGLFLLALRIMLWSEHRWALTIAALLLSAVHLALARLLPKTAEKETPVARILLAGLALTFATLAIPIRLEGKWITLAWAVEGAVLIWSGFRVATPLLRHAGYLLLSAAALRLVFLPIPAKQFIVNARFAAFAVLVACFAAALLAARRSWDNLTDNEKLAYGVFAVAVHAYAIAALSLELWDYFGRSALSMDRALAQQLALSILWVAYATGLILFGVKRDSALLRWQALALFGIVVLKVFFFDLSFLERFYRILSFLFLGLVLLVVSFLYQRKLQRRPSRP